MDITEILQREEFKEFKELDNLLNSQMKKKAGKKLYVEMLELFGDHYRAREWFYTIVPALGHKMPYELCAEGKKSKSYKIVQGELTRVQHGILT